MVWYQLKRVYSFLLSSQCTTFVLLFARVKHLKRVVCGVFWKQTKKKKNSSKKKHRTVSVNNRRRTESTSDYERRTSVYRRVLFLFEFVEPVVGTESCTKPRLPRRDACERPPRKRSPARTALRTRAITVRRESFIRLSPDGLIVSKPATFGRVARTVCRRGHASRRRTVSPGGRGQVDFSRVQRNENTKNKQRSVGRMKYKGDFSKTK